MTDSDIEREAYNNAASFAWQMAAKAAPTDIAYRKYLMARVILFAERAAALGDRNVFITVLPGARKYLSEVDGK